MLQLNLPVLLFGILALIKLRESPEAAMLDVFFPVLLLVPAIYYLHIPHVPRISCYDAALLPLGIAAVATRYRSWKFQRNDLWIFLFAVAGFYTDYLNLGFVTALYNFLEPGFLGGLFAYFIGKILIEQGGNRVRVVQRIVTLLAFVSLISVSEFVIGRNLLVICTKILFGSIDYWGDQFRYGFVRVKGPYLGPEEAGIVILIGLFFSFWLWYIYQRRKSQYLLPSSKLSPPAYTGAILLGLIMTLSRGPELGAVAGFLVARIGMVKKKRQAIIIAVALISLGLVYARHTAAKMQAIADEAVLDESNASATYRTRLYNVYKPVAEAGGMFGWSATGYKDASARFPQTSSYHSIDNEFLLLWVTQGKVGLALFVLIAVEAALALVQAIRKSQNDSDICFYYCMAGLFTGLITVLVTVYLAGQGYILFFLLSGWIQSISAPKLAEEHTPFRFRRVLA